MDPRGRSVRRAELLRERRVESGAGAVVVPEKRLRSNRQLVAWAGHAAVVLGDEVRRLDGTAGVGRRVTRGEVECIIL